MPTIIELADSGFQKIDQLTQKVSSNVTILASAKHSVDALANTVDGIHQTLSDTQRTVNDRLDALRRSTDSLSATLSTLTGAARSGPIKEYEGEALFWKSWSGSPSFGWTYAEVSGGNNVNAFLTQDIKTSQALLLSKATGARLLVGGSIIDNVDDLPAEVKNEIERQRDQIGKYAPANGVELVIHWLEWVQVLGPPSREEFTVRAESYANRIVVYASLSRSGGRTGLSADQFSLRTLMIQGQFLPPLPPGMHDFTLGSVQEIGEGCYLLTLTPHPFAFTWDRGSYLLALTVSGKTMLVTV